MQLCRLQMIMMNGLLCFGKFLQSNKYKIDPELLAAKIGGRWRTAFPLALSRKY